MNQQLALEQIIQNLEEPLSEDQFVALCRALRVTDSASIEWALDWLSISSFLAAD